jgi:hypothetical protein
MCFVAAAAPTPCAVASAFREASALAFSAAIMTEPTVNSLAQATALLMASASRLPAVAPFTMAAVMPSMPEDAPCAALAAVCSMLDRPELTVLMDALALLTSTSTTSSSLLSATVVQLFAIQTVAFFFEDEHGEELIGPDLVESDPHAQLQGCAEVDGAADEQAGLGGLGCIQTIERAVIAAAAVRRVRAQSRIAEFIAPEGPVDEIPEGGVFRPLPGQKFGSRSSWKPASSASMAAFTATAWWMTGTSPA